MNLQRQGFEVFLPRLREHRGREMKLVSMFPGYIFIGFDAETTHWLHINGTRGIKRLMLSTREFPSLLPAGWVEKLKEEGGVFDMFLDALGFKKGDLIEFMDGPFQGHQGVCQWTSEKRVALLLDLLGRETMVIAESRAVKLAQKNDLQ